MEIEHRSRSRRTTHEPLSVRTVVTYSKMAVRYSRMAARSGELLDVELGEPMLTGGDEDERDL